jgi:hypothetical protein
VLRAIPWLLLASLLVCAAKAASLPNSDEGRRPRVFVNLGCNWYRYHDDELKAQVTSNATDVEALDKIARQYAKAFRLRFDFAQTQPRLLILRKTNYLACMWYASTKGQPAFLCSFDFDRKVVGHGIGIATRSAEELPKILLGVESVRVESGLVGVVTNFLTPEYLMSLVRDHLDKLEIKVDFSQQQTGIAIKPNHRFLDVFTDYGNYRADIRFNIDFDKNVTFTWISPEMRSKGLEINEGKLERAGIKSKK